MTVTNLNDSCIARSTTANPTATNDLGVDCDEHVDQGEDDQHSIHGYLGFSLKYDTKLIHRSTEA